MYVLFSDRPTYLGFSQYLEHGFQANKVFIAWSQAA